VSVTSRAVLAVCTVLATIAAGCAPKTRVIPIAVASGQPRAAAERIADYPQAFQAIAFVMSQDLQLPVPPVTLYLYPTRAAFAQGLVVERKFDPEVAEEAASFSRGVGGPEKILVNEGALARAQWPERIRFLSHEFTHTIQYALARDRRSTSEQWLREGFADYVSFRVMESLGLDTYMHRRANRVREVRSVRDKAFPALSQMTTFPQWVHLRSRQGSEATYGQAFLAVDLLIARAGYPAAVEYFRLFAGSDDRLANFRAAFGRDLPAFEREFEAHLQSLR
jgi:hypothetical protein